MERDEIETLAALVADSLWLSAVADAVDRAADDGHPGAREFRPGAGGDWKDTDYRPVPPSFLAVALSAADLHRDLAGVLAMRRARKEAAQPFEAKGRFLAGAFDPRGEGIA